MSNNSDITDVYSLLDEETIYLFVLINPKALDINPFTNTQYFLIPTNFYFQNVYFCNHTGIKYGGRDYLPIPCSISDLTYTANSEASPTITVGDSKGIIGSIIDNNRGIEGSELSVQRIKRRCLDDGSTPNYAFRTPPEIFKIANLTSRTSKAISYKLKPRVTFKSQIPGRTLVESCSWRQYKGAGCGYSGTAMFDEANRPVTDPSKDVCSRTRNGCNLRNNFLNYGGVPSINSF